MKIVFLDIDGVINGHEHCHLKEGVRINPKPASYLNNLLERSGAKVVLISSWRRWINDGHMTCHGFSRVLWSHGVDAKVIDALPAYDESKSHRDDRREKLLQWLEDHPEVTSYVILDDLDLQLENLIRPNPAIGLMPVNVTEALQILG